MQINEIVVGHTCYKVNDNLIWFCLLIGRQPCIMSLVDVVDVMTENGRVFSFRDKIIKHFVIYILHHRHNEIVQIVAYLARFVYLLIVCFFGNFALLDT